MLIVALLVLVAIGIVYGVRAAAKLVLALAALGAIGFVLLILYVVVR